MSRSEEIEELKRKRTVSKGKFTRKANLFAEVQSEGVPFTVMQGIFEEVETAFKDVEQFSDRIIEVTLENNMEETLVGEVNEYLGKLESKKTKLKIDLEKERVKQSISVELNQSNTLPRMLSVKKLDPPTFSGDIREFPNFKQDYERLVVPNYGRDPYALRKCLLGEALDSVKGLEDDHGEMFKRLEQKFGNHRKIMDMIVNDLRVLKPLSDGDDKGLIRTVEIVERCYLDLKKMNLESEMNSTNVLGLVERVLPPTQKREWVAIMDDNSVNDKGTYNLEFKNLLDYLLTQKRRIEYMGSAVRSAGNNRSNINTISCMEDQETDLYSTVKDLQGNHIKLERQISNLTRVINNLTVDKKSNTNNKSSNDPLWCWFHESNAHGTCDCYHFKSLNDEEKVKLIRRKGLCYNCLDGQHLSKDCVDRDSCSIMVGNKPCGLRHHPLLHWARVNGIMYHTSRIVNDHQKTKVLLMVSSVYHYQHPINVLWDSGSDITIITHSAARKLGLRGKDIQLTVTKVGNIVENCVSKEYIISLVDKLGKVWQIKAYGMEEITSTIQEVDPLELSRILEVQPSFLVRPAGNVDMLVGSDCCQLLPHVIKTVGNLQLLENQFGFCVRGSVGVGEDHSSAHVTLNHATASIRTNEIEISTLPNIKNSLDKIFDNDLRPTNECACKQGVIDDCTIREERELKLIEEGLTYDQNNKIWEVKYPWVKDPFHLPNNIGQAMHRMKATEKRLLKSGAVHTKLYQDQIDEMIISGIARKLTKEEISSYTGPIHYLHHHEVIKPGSSSTPMRIVFDSSSSYQGHQLNSYWAKGPDILNSLVGVLLRMRQEKVVVIGDISRMYHTIRLNEMDQHTHRFIWRNLDFSKSPDHYALTRVTFGDRPSGIIATLALRHTAEKYLTDYPQAAKMIMKNTYVDDMIQSIPNEAEAAKLIRDAEFILSSGGFVVKHWVMSGSDTNYHDIKLLQTETEKVLGMSWDVKDDQFFYRVKINFSQRKKKIHTEPNISINEIGWRFPTILTRRMILSQVASIFDPLGLVQPFTLTAKLLMREMILNSKGEGWDDPIAEEYRRKWETFFKELYKLENFRLRRLMKPSDTVGNPSLVIFSDGSKQAYGAVAYCRFLTHSGDYKSAIIAAKCKVAPVKQLSIPRIELCAALLSCRLREKIVEEIDWHFESVYHLIDSDIVRQQIQKDSYKFKSFVGTRIAEIQNKSCINEWCWISSEVNPADMLTRPTDIEKMSGDSIWQNGPQFLLCHTDSWPIKQTKDVELPDMIGQTLASNNSIVKPLLQDNLLSNGYIFDIDRFSSYSKLLRVTSRIMNAIKAKSFFAIGNRVSSQEMKEAEKLWIKSIQKEFSNDWHKRFQRLGPEINNEGLITVGNRMRAWLRQNWNHEDLILLPPKHRFTRLYVSHIHQIDHLGIETTIAKIQRKFWIPGLRRIVKSVKHRCVTCKKLSQRCEGQRMGELVEERLKPSPPFYHTACDIFGPFRIRDTVKRRTFGKAFGIIFNCLSTRSVYLDLLEGYDTQSFLTVFRRFVSIRGYPNSLYSDRGSQFVSAERELKQMFRKLDFEVISNFGREQGMDWVFTKSSDAPWQNGISEALIKSVKRSLKVVIGDSIFSFGEFQTVLFEIANLLNERPIGIKPGSDVSAGCYLCPNELLLGRASNHAPVGLWLENNNNKRLEFLNKLVGAFWRKWQRDFFPTLLIQQKWHTAKRNVRIGDLVIVQDSNVIRGVWRMAQVVEAPIGRDGFVRDVIIRYKILKSGAKYEGASDVKLKRSVHRLVVILPVEEQ